MTVSPTFEVIGAPGAAEYLKSGADPCFGKIFSKSAPECKVCRAPVIYNGRVLLMRDMCVMNQRGTSTPVELVRLTSHDVLERLERQVPLGQIFAEILGEAPPDLAAAAARQLLVDRLLHLETRGFAKITIPRTKQLLEQVKRDVQDHTSD